MKQTAVEYLIENLIFINSKNWDSIVDQAKELEKQQIIDAFHKQTQKFYCEEEAEQYYNETFKNK